jgi:hypothetical protein
MNIKELLESKTDIKLHFHTSTINGMKKCRKFLNLCYKMGIVWNGENPKYRPQCVFVTNHVKGYRLTFTNEKPGDVDFFNKHKAKLIKL